jgi:hypothetical protein
MDEPKDEIIEINGHKYLVLTRTTANGRTVLDYERKIPIPIKMGDMRFTRVSNQINKAPKSTFK